jgi:hypothetical protein
VGLLLFLAVSAAVHAPRAGAFEVGLQDDTALISGTPSERRLALDRAQALGVTWVKMSVVWAGYASVGLEPYDRAVNLARSRGMNIQLLLSGSPKFLGGSRYLTYYRPSPARFATFAATVARHFKGRVQAYSLWNEPNLGLYLSPVRDAPVIYRNLFRAGYYAIKRVDPSVRVLFGETSPSSNVLRFIETAAQGPGIVADGFAHHPYQLNLVRPGGRDTRYVGISNIPLIRSTLLRLAREHKLRTRTGGVLPMYFTEFGYPRPGAYYGYFSEGIRAYWTVLAYRLAKRMGARTLVYYGLYRQPGRALPRKWDTGLLSPDGFEWPIYRSLLGARVSLIGS